MLIGLYEFRKYYVKSFYLRYLKRKCKKIGILYLNCICELLLYCIVYNKN